MTRPTWSFEKQAVMGRGSPGCTSLRHMNCIQAHVGFADVRFHSVQEAQSAASGQPPCLHGAMKTFPNTGGCYQDSSRFSLLLPIRFLTTTAGYTICFYYSCHWLCGGGSPGCTPFSHMNCIQAHIGFADVRFHSVQEASVRSIRTTLVLDGAMHSWLPAWRKVQPVLALSLVYISLPVC